MTKETVSGSNGTTKGLFSQWNSGSQERIKPNCLYHVQECMWTIKVSIRYQASSSAHQSEEISL